MSIHEQHKAGHNHGQHSGAYASVAKTFVFKNLPDSEIELVGEVPFELIAPLKEQALTTIAKEMSVPGFRPGHVPAHVARARVSNLAVLEDAVDLVLQDLYPALLAEYHPDIVGRPDIRITKLAEGNPVGLTIVAAVYPEVTLPKNWKTVGEGVEEKAPEAVTDEEVEKTLVSLHESRKAKNKDSDASISDLPADQEPSPVFDDAFAQSLGAFENMTALREQIKKGIAEEKLRAAKDARRATIVDTLIAGVSVVVPKVFVESELDKIIGQMREDVGRFGMTFEEYLKRVEKTEDTVRDEFREQAAKRARLQLTLNKIASDEKIEVDPEEVEKELKHAIEHFPQANRAMARVHIESVMRNEKVLQLLENTKK